MIKKLKPAALFLILTFVLQGIAAQTQVNITSELSKKFLNFTESVPREEIFVHSDRQDYVSGEDLWFNIFLFDRQSQKPSSLSKIAYIELLNAENRPVAQKKIFLENGSGPGQFVLPDSLSSGIYTLRAYTNWMKNFLPDNCYSSEIRIYNIFSSKKAASRKIVADQNPLPDYKNSGLSLIVDNLKPDILEIYVSTEEKYRSENSPEFYLFIQTHGIINRVSSEMLSGGKAKILIPKNQLTQGINQITVFNSTGQPVAERYIYTPRNNQKLIALDCPDSIGTRKKVMISLTGNKAFSALIKNARLSVSVAPVSDNPELDDINDYMVFASEYGQVNLDVKKYKTIDQMPAEVMDSLLTNIRSNWINWNTVLSDKKGDYRYPIENEDHYITGKLSGAGAGSMVTLSAPGKTADFQYAKTDVNGNFNLRLNINRKINDLVIQPDDPLKNPSLSIENAYSDRYYKTVQDTSGLQIPESLQNLGINYQVRKIYGITYNNDTVSQIFQPVKLRRFYGKPDQQVIMSEYITLPVMQEVFFELLVGVFLKSRKGGYEITMNDPVNNVPYDQPPGLFIDGVMVKDASVIANLDPELVEKIDVVRHKYFVGNYLFTGIVNIITKAGDFTNVNLPAYALRIPYRVIDSETSFSSPDYSSPAGKNLRQPDFRNTLYWNPSVKPDNKGNAGIELWTSDFISDFIVRVEGTTDNGETFSVKKIIRVRK